jgi:hypothetical protein
MSRSAGTAAKLPGSERRKLAVQALAGSEPISELSARLGVSRKFTYAQKDKASDALYDAFCSAVADDEVLFQLPVTRTWLRQVMVELPLICRSSYRGVVEFMRDLLRVTVGVGSVHEVLHGAARQAGAINREQDLSGIRVGLHDELFQGATPVLAGVDAQSTYCYLLAAERHRDADTWGVHLLDASRQGLAPDYTIADAGQGLRAGQKAAWGDTPCHGDVFHILHQCEKLANTLGNLARGARTRREKLEAKVGKACSRKRDGSFAAGLKRARQAEVQARQLARDIRSLTQWLSHDILALAGPVLATRQICCSTSWSMSRNGVSSWIHAASARCASRCRTSATTCWPSPAFSMRNSRGSRRPRASPPIWCAPRACCIENPRPRPRTGKAGGGYDLNWAASSRPSSRPWRRSCNTRRAAVHWWRISTRGCATTSRCAVIWAPRISTCCASS